MIMALFPKSIVQFQSLSTTKEELHAFDVMLGRGTGVAQHFGNANFRRLVDKHRPRYQKASKSEKMGISRAIVDEIARHGGQFLLPELVSGAKQEQQVRFWIVPHKQAVSKTSQALRELKKSTKRAAKIRAALHLTPQGLAPVILKGRPQTVVIHASDALVTKAKRSSDPRATTRAQVQSNEALVREGITEAGTSSEQSSKSLLANVGESTSPGMPNEEHGATSILNSTEVLEASMTPTAAPARPKTPRLPVKKRQFRSLAYAIGNEDVAFPASAKLFKCRQPLFPDAVEDAPSSTIEEKSGAAPLDHAHAETARMQGPPNRHPKPHIVPPLEGYDANCSNMESPTSSSLTQPLCCFGDSPVSNTGNAPDFRLISAGSQTPQVQQPEASWSVSTSRPWPRGSFFQGRDNALVVNAIRAPAIVKYVPPPNAAFVVPAAHQSIMAQQSSFMSSGVAANERKLVPSPASMTIGDDDDDSGKIMTDAVIFDLLSAAFARRNYLPSVETAGDCTCASSSNHTMISGKSDDVRMSSSCSTPTSYFSRMKIVNDGSTSGCSHKEPEAMDPSSCLFCSPGTKAEDCLCPGPIRQSPVVLPVDSRPLPQITLPNFHPHPVAEDLWKSPDTTDSTFWSPIGKEISVHPAAKQMTTTRYSSQLREASPAPMRMFASSISSFGPVDTEEVWRRTEVTSVGMSLHKPSSHSKRPFGGVSSPELAGWTPSPLPVPDGLSTAGSTSNHLPGISGIELLAAAAKTAKVLDFGEDLGSAVVPERQLRSSKKKSRRSEIDTIAEPCGRPHQEAPDTTYYRSSTIYLSPGRRVSDASFPSWNRSVEAYSHPAESLAQNDEFRSHGPSSRRVSY